MPPVSHALDTTNDKVSVEGMQEQDARADSLIVHADSISYWNSISPDVNGMLGGYPQISRIDLQGSTNFIRKVSRLSAPRLTRSITNGNAGKGADIQQERETRKLRQGLDCGAGIGRVTLGCLLHVCECVDIVEPVEKFANVLSDSPEKTTGAVGSVYISGLEDWTPADGKKYDLIWNQWCLGHLTDQQLTEYFVKCKAALSQEDEGGWMGVKENMSTRLNGSDIFDETDSSVTRSDESFRRIFEQSGWKVIRSELQTGFPRGLGLYPVRMYALRPSLI